jgi:uncharacterized protein (TIGR04222 family)
MNPFDLRGPQFLLFYIALSAVLIGVAIVLRRVFESGPIPRIDADPYLLAYLRGGTNEAIRVAAISLVDRGLLRAKDETLAAEPRAVERVHRPLERAILAEFATPAVAWSIFAQRRARAACADLARDLRRRGLVPSGVHWSLRGLLFLGGVMILVWIADTKIAIAAARGHYNVGFLQFLAFVSPIALLFALRDRTTTVGKRLLEDFQTLFSNLRDRSHEIRTGGATNELALLAGIFGLSALSGPAFAQADVLFPKGMKGPGWGSKRATACGAACGHASDSSDSSSGSCGSGCGGGGCGGGCGGCGS